mmetsp:Transcript_30203/g.71337  ORF Transcript_30203/g.71337 Transcript_30203/m.71337 type:complete len:254 (+) Transcript_30203:400-1161(+)
MSLSAVTASAYDVNASSPVAEALRAAPAKKAVAPSRRPATMLAGSPIETEYDVTLEPWASGSLHVSDSPEADVASTSTELWTTGAGRSGGVVPITASLSSDVPAALLQRMCTSTSVPGRRPMSVTGVLPSELRVSAAKFLPLHSETSPMASTAVGTQAVTAAPPSDAGGAHSSRRWRRTGLPSTSVSFVAGGARSTTASGGDGAMAGTSSRRSMLLTLRPSGSPFGRFSATTRKLTCLPGGRSVTVVASSSPE